MDTGKKQKSCQGTKGGGGGAGGGSSGQKSHKKTNHQGTEGKSERAQGTSAGKNKAEHTGQKKTGTEGRLGSAEGSSSGKKSHKKTNHQGTEGKSEHAQGTSAGKNKPKNKAKSGGSSESTKAVTNRVDWCWQMETGRGGWAGMSGAGSRGGAVHGGSTANASIWGRRNATGGRGRGGYGGQGARGNPNPGSAEREGAKRKTAAGANPGGHRRDSPRSDNGPRKRGLGFQSLLELSAEDPSVIAITLSSHPLLKTVLSEPGMRQDLVELLCLVLSKAFRSRSDRVTRQHLANIVKDSGFFQTNLTLYLGGMGSESNPVRRSKYPQHLDNILVILSEVVAIFPASSVHAVSMLVTLFEASVNSLRALGVDVQPTVDERLELLRVLIGHLQERSREGTLRSDKDSYALLPEAEDEEEHENFRTIPIYPTLEEFHQDERPFLRQNLTSRRYTNTHLYLDTHFRLLREDFVRPLREGVQQIIQDKKEAGDDDKSLEKRKFDDIRIYFNTQLVVPVCTHSGIAYTVRFDVQPLKFVRWENSKRLLYGSLVVLSSDNFESFLFATVSDRDPKKLQKGEVQIVFTEESRYKLVDIQDEEVFLMVETTAFFEAYRYVLEGLQEQVEEDLPFQRYIVECSSEVHPPAYLGRNDVYDLKSVTDQRHKHRIPPFSCLKPEAWPEMTKLGLDESQMKAFQMALTKELAIVQGPPGTGKTYVGLKIAQALLTNQVLWNDENDQTPMLIVCYTNHALDQFLEGIHSFLKCGIVRVGSRSNSEILKGCNLRELTSPKNPHYQRSSRLHRAHDDVYGELRDAEKEIQRCTQQIECSLKGVLRETFLRSCISDAHWHSLNQYQHGYLGMRKRRPSMILEWLGLSSLVVQQMEPENADEVNLGAAAMEEEYMELEEGEFIRIKEEAELIQAERIIDDWTIVQRDPDYDKKKIEMEKAVRKLETLMLSVNLDGPEAQDEETEDGFQMQRAQMKKMKKKIIKEVKQGAVMSEEEEATVPDVWALSQKDRWRLYRLWMMRYRTELRLKTREFQVTYQNAADRLAEVKRYENYRVLKQAKVIGMTTTGAAKYRQVLQQVAPRLVIVEEAAEVLEAHTITTLSKACQHLILIGDHQQLRPSATVYELAKNFNLEMSMFERLVNTGVPYVRLNYQHRMRPEIARLLTPHIYSELENHQSVFRYENIKGLKTNMFFVEHDHPEEQIRDGKSHQNHHEAKFVVALCRYFLLQDYEPGQITILTTYTGQFNCLRQLMPAKEFSGVKVHVVDKYQGEENDIVLLSLVRSNAQGKVGFLSIPNRVCVALSRAKKGLFCIGNSENLRQVKLWANIFQTLTEDQKIGKALILCCQNHPTRQVKASCAEDFKQAPEGGCTEPCQFRLECGHVCTRACHPADPEHKLYQCAKPCQKILCGLEHKCPLFCFMDCPKECPVNIEKIIPKCQHTQIVPCQQDPGTFICRMPCQKLLPCGHPCTSSCGEPCTGLCLKKITLELQCGHSQQGACFQKEQKYGPKCKGPCEHQLKCGHACQGTCGGCHQGRFHSPCSYACERLLICSHKCEEPCTRDCPPCRRPCENCCVHSKCMRPCGMSCSPCVEPCPWECPHQRCTKLCHEPCDRPPCTVPCDKTLDCGHPCIGLCGEVCPSKCRICNREEVSEIFFGTEDEPDAHFIQLEGCRHIFEYTAMDRYMNLDAHDLATDGEQVAIKLKECPRCRTPIRKNLRYGSSINRSLAEIEMVKQKINGPQQSVNQQRKLLQLQLKPNSAVLDWAFSEEYKTIRDSLASKNLTATDLWLLENKMDYLIRVAKLMKMAYDHGAYFADSWLGECVSEFVGWIKHRHQKFTEQQASDLQREMSRLTIVAELETRCAMAEEIQKTDKINDDVRKIKGMLQSCFQFTEEDERRAKEAMTELNKKVPLSGLGINEEERKMIVSAMKMAPGHWHKCPNGHVYVITECGGAMERRKCPDCDASIGGGSHRLDSGNVVATEMDGAQHSAWSEINNIRNFDQDDFLHM